MEKYRIISRAYYESNQDCEYNLVPDCFECYTDNDAIARYKDVIKQYEDELKRPFYNEQSITLCLSLFKCPNGNGIGIPTLLGYYEIIKHRYGNAFVGEPCTDGFILCEVIKEELGE